MSFKESVFYRITNDAPLGYHYLHVLACHARCLIVFVTITDFISKQIYGESWMFRYINLNIPSSKQTLKYNILAILTTKNELCISEYEHMHLFSMVFHTYTGQHSSENLELWYSKKKTLTIHSLLLCICHSETFYYSVYTNGLLSGALKLNY